jgi:hypothetical protein
MKRMNKIKYLGLAVLMIAGIASAGEDAEMDRPYFEASVTREVSAEVTAIDHATRIVTVRTENGEMHTFNVSEEVRNLGQVGVGDMLYAMYDSVYTVEVLPNDGQEATAAAVDAVARAEEGAMPGMAAMETTVISATVEEINLEANTFKLKGPEGNVTEYTARNPENLKRAKVGDLVVMTVTEAVAITVESASE